MAYLKAVSPYLAGTNDENYGKVTTMHLLRFQPGFFRMKVWHFSLVINSPFDHCIYLMAPCQRILLYSLFYLPTYAKERKSGIF